MDREATHGSPTDAPRAATPGERAAAASSLLPAGSLASQLIWLALPMLGEQLLNFLVGLVDTLLAGQISKEATAAVGAANYLNWIVMLAFSLVGVGASALVSRALGAGDARTANRALHQAMILAAILGVGVCGVTFFLSPQFARFLTQTERAYGPTVEFSRIIAFTYVLGSINLIGSGVLRAAGDTRTPLTIMTVVNIVNVVGSLLLVRPEFGLQWGVAGIATGALVARCVGGVLMLLVLANGRGLLRLRTSELRNDWDVMRRILRVGLPAAADTGVMSVAQLLFIRIIAQSDQGDAATANFAAHIIGVEMEAISYMPAFAWGTAAATLVGQYLGAGQPDRSARAGRIALLQGAALGLLNCTIFVTCARPIFALMTNDPAVIEVGVPAFRLLGFAQPFLCTAIIAITALRGAGDTRTTAVMSIIGGLFLRVPVAYFGAIYLHGGLIGAWCGMWSDNLAKCALGVTRFLRGDWKRIRV